MAANLNEVRARERLRVLIVDDVASNLLILEAILGRDYDLLVAMTGEEALRIVAEKQPDLIVLDVKLPDMDGYEVCRRLKRDAVTRSVPVIFCTALDEVDDERQGFEVGAVDYVTKPLCEPVVQARVRAHLSVSQHSRMLTSTVHAQTAQLARLGRLQVSSRRSSPRRSSPPAPRMHSKRTAARSPRCAATCVDSRCSTRLRIPRKSWRSSANTTRFSAA